MQIAPTENPTMLDTTRQQLLRANHDRKHPFRFFCLGTIGDFPELRTVVLRKATQEFDLLVYTDSRSAKVAQMYTNPQVTALLYHPRKKLQLKIQGSPEFIRPDHPEYEALFKRLLNSPALTDYTTVNPPGTPLPESGIAHGDEVHFLPFWIRAQNLDIVQLKTDQHTRSAYTKHENNWIETKLVP